MNLAPKSPRSTRLSRLATLGLCAVSAAASVFAVACSDSNFKEGRTFATLGGSEETGHVVDAKTLNDGHDSYMLYCYACHGENGDGKGPSSYGLRPPPRDFTKGIFKFARLRSSDELPHDEDLKRILKGGLHGSAMLAWDIPEIELDRIVQYIKTFAPEKWEKKSKKTGEPVKTLEPFVAPEDPWAGKEADAVLKGKELYHLKAECVNCHPSYGTMEEIYKLSVDANKRQPDAFKPITGFREDPYGSVAKDSSEYGVRIMPPDFTFHEVRSVRNRKTEMADLFRIISFGVYPIMPAWKGALSDNDIWAIAHYVKSLMDIRMRPESFAMRQRFATQGKFEIPKPVEDKPADPAVAPAPTATPAAPADKKDAPKKPDAKP